MKILLTAFAMSCSLVHAEVDPRLEVFPPSDVQVPAAQRGKTTLSTDYRPSGSLWDSRLDERWVFALEMRHQQEAPNSFALRVGKGGQIYSLRGPFGESVPPSWRGHESLSPWNDEVWQFVAVCSKYNGLKALSSAGKVPEEVAARFKQLPYKTSFFVHNSGVYIPGGSAIKNLYCPLLASAPTPDGRGYRTLNWGLVPQVKTVHRSPLLYYCQVRDVGEGVIELTWVVHNFSGRDDVVFDHLNAPWGGTRVSSLPHHFVSSPSGELTERSDKPAVDVRATGGWNLSCASEAPDSPSLALVFGRDKHLEEELRKVKAGKPHCQFSPSLYRDWRAGAPLYKTAWKDWQTRPANSFRNYDVAVIIPKFRLAPGTTLWYRSFLVVNRKDRALELAKSLVDHVDYGLVTCRPDDTPRITISVKGDRVVSGVPPAPGSRVFRVFAQPVAGAKPLFLLRNTNTGRRVITTDPYFFVPKEKIDFGLPPDHPSYDYYSQAFGYSMDRNATQWETLLGFAYTRKPADGSVAPLSKLLDAALFPAPDSHHLDVWVETGG